MHREVSKNYRIDAVLTGMAEPIDSKSGLSGINKIVQRGRVRVTREGLAGDTIIDRENHGGPDQALLVQGSADSAWWEEQLGRPVPPGTFGENLYLDGLDSAAIAIGDMFDCGGFRLQVTAPRIPCETLAARMGDPLFPKRFMAAGRPGFYCRVLDEGMAEAGMIAAHVPYYGPRVSVAAVLGISKRNRPDNATIAALVNAPAHHKMAGHLRQLFPDAPVFSPS
jgi:MOSC domain-containing protein YiiM